VLNVLNGICGCSKVRALKDHVQATAPTSFLNGQVLRGFSPTRDVSDAPPLSSFLTNQQVKVDLKNVLYCQHPTISTLTTLHRQVLSLQAIRQELS
jgi:hypothetical protein